MGTALIPRGAAKDALEVLYETGLPRPLSLRTFRILTSGIAVSATMGSIATVLALESDARTPTEPLPSPLVAALTHLSAPILFGLILPLVVVRAVARAKTRNERMWLGVIANAAGTVVLAMAVGLVDRWARGSLESLVWYAVPSVLLGVLALGPSALLLAPIGAWTSPRARTNACGEKEPFADDFSAKIVARLGLWLAVAAAGTVGGAAFLLPSKSTWQPFVLGSLPAIGGVLCGLAIAAYGWFHAVETRRWLARVASGNVPRVRIRPDDATQPLALLPPLVTEALCDGVVEVDNAGVETAHPFRHRSSTPVRRAPLSP